MAILERIQAALDALPVETDVDMDGHRIRNLPEPEDDNDAVSTATAPVQSVNGETGDVSVEVDGGIDKTAEALTFDESEVNIVGSELDSREDELQIAPSNFVTGPSTDFSPGAGSSNDDDGLYGARLTVEENISGFRVPGTRLNEESYPITLELRVSGDTVDSQELDDEEETAEFVEAISAGTSNVDLVADLDNSARRDTNLDLPRDVDGVVTVESGLVEGSFEDDEVALLEGIETLVGADSGTASVELPTPDVRSWNLASFQRRQANGNVDVFIEEDDGSGFTEIAGPISRNHQIQADDGSDVRFRVEISGNTNDGTPALESAYIQYDV